MLYFAMWFGWIVLAVLFARRAGQSPWRWGVLVAFLPSLILLVFQYSRTDHVVLARRQWCIRVLVMLSTVVVAVLIGDASSSWPWLAQWYAKGVKLVNSEMSLFVEGTMLSSPTRNYQINTLPALIMSSSAFGCLHGLLMLRRPDLWAIGLTCLGFLIGVTSDFLLAWHTFLAIDSSSAIYPLKAAVSLSYFAQLAMSLVLVSIVLRHSPPHLQKAHI